jgi:hypothetical protein
MGLSARRFVDSGRRLGYQPNLAGVEPTPRRLVFGRIRAEAPLTNRND